MLLNLVLIPDKVRQIKLLLFFGFARCALRLAAFIYYSTKHELFLVLFVSNTDALFSLSAPLIECTNEVCKLGCVI